VLALDSVYIWLLSSIGRHKFAFKNKLQQLLHLSSPILVMKWLKIQKHKTNLPGNAHSSSYCLHMPSINWYCLDNVLIIFLITPFKKSLLHIYNLSWKSNTWNVIPLALTKYLYMMYNVHHIHIHNSFYFHCNFFVSFSLTWIQDFHIRW